MRYVSVPEEFCSTLLDLLHRCSKDITCYYFYDDDNDYSWDIFLVIDELNKYIRSSENVDQFKTPIGEIYNLKG